MNFILASGIIGWVSGGWPFVLSWSQVAFSFTGLVMGFWVFILLAVEVFLKTNVGCGVLM